MSDQSSTWMTSLLAVSTNSCSSFSLAILALSCFESMIFFLALICSTYSSPVASILISASSVSSNLLVQVVGSNILRYAFCFSTSPLQVPTSHWKQYRNQPTMFFLEFSQKCTEIQTYIATVFRAARQLLAKCAIFFYFFEICLYFIRLEVNLFLIVRSYSWLVVFVVSLYHF